MSEKLKRIPAVETPDGHKFTLGVIDWSKDQNRSVTDLGDGTFEIVYIDKITLKKSGRVVVRGKLTTVPDVDPKKLAKYISD